MMKVKLTNLIEKQIRLFTEQKLDFAFTRIEKVKDNDLININVYLLEDVKRFVKNINIYGNEITEEKVIRNQLEFVEGDSFSSRKLKNSIIKSNQLEYLKIQNIKLQKKIII